MEKYKHISGLVAIPFSESVYQIQGTAFYIPVDLLISGKDWEEIKKKKEYPIGTKIRNIKFNVIITKIERNQWQAETKTSFFNFDEDVIDTEYELIDVPKAISIPQKEFTILAFKNPFLLSQQSIDPRQTLYADSQLKDTFCRENGKAPFFRLDWCLKNEFPICSVRRESDGKIFTVGERINRTAPKMWDGNIITEIIMYNNEPLIRTKFGGYPYKAIH